MDIIFWILNAIWAVIKFIWMIPVNIIEFFYPDNISATIIGHLISVSIYLIIIGIGALFEYLDNKSGGNLTRATRNARIIHRIQKRT